MDIKCLIGASRILEQVASFHHPGGPYRNRAGWHCQPGRGVPKGTCLEEVRYEVYVWLLEVWVCVKIPCGRLKNPWRNDKFQPGDPIGSTADRERGALESSGRDS